MFQMLALEAYAITAGPFNHEVCQVLRLSNPNQEAVVFKVRPLNVLSQTAQTNS